MCCSLFAIPSVLPSSSGHPFSASRAKQQEDREKALKAHSTLLRPLLLWSERKFPHSEIELPAIPLLPLLPPQVCFRLAHMRTEKRKRKMGVFPYIFLSFQRPFSHSSSQNWTRVSPGALSTSVDASRFQAALCPHQGTLEKKEMLKSPLVWWYFEFWSSSQSLQIVAPGFCNYLQWEQIGGYLPHFIQNGNLSIDVFKWIKNEISVWFGGHKFS